MERPPSGFRDLTTVIDQRTHGGHPAGEPVSGDKR